MIEWPKTIYQKIKNPFIKGAVKIGITANQLTVINHVIMLTIGCYFFSRGSYLCGLGGLAVCIINGFLDYLDGDLARIKKEDSGLGEWLDTGFDVVIQNAVLGAIGIGCFKMGAPIWLVVMFFIGSSANNFVSFYYNHKFGFSSANGNELFRELMDKKNNWFNLGIKRAIDPTSDGYALFVFTYRYWVAIGAVLNIMPEMFAVMVIISNYKWVAMYIIYAKYLSGDTDLHVLKVLKRLDDEQEEFYRVQSG